MADEYYDPEGDDCPYSWLNEWLCEYVDGTMDPSVRAVFEEYLEANPELAEHVERLCRTRSLLCQCKEQRHAASDELQARLRQQAEREMMQESVSFLTKGNARLRMAAAVGSVMVVMLAVGVVVGATFFGEAPPQQQEVVTNAPASEAPQQASSGSDLRLNRPSFSDRRAPQLMPLSRTPTLQDQSSFMRIGSMSGDFWEVNSATVDTGGASGQAAFTVEP